MNITSVKLNPFGGINNKEIIFEKGLNVIIGPNEAGKSTIFNSIQKILFVPSKINKTTFENEIRNFIPIGGGDTIRVELQFNKDDETFKLRRVWGASRSSELTLPDGNIVTDEDFIAHKLESLLPAKEGTYKSVLMTYQSGLSKTLYDLKNDIGTIYSLKDIIRKAMMETDGISVDKFKERIENLYDEYFSHWDQQQNYPEKGRGIENPWKKSVGRIVDAFYSQEFVKFDLDYARDFEEKLDGINQQISQCENTINVKENYIKENKKAVEDALERQILDAETRAINLEITELMDINNQWPIIENDISELKLKKPKCEEKLKALKQEKEEAEIQEQNKDIRAKFQRIQQKQNALDEAEQNLKYIQQLTKDELEIIRKADNDVEKLKASIAAGKITIEFQAKKEIKFSVQKDFEDSFLQEVSGNESIQFLAGGKVKLEHNDWIIEATSGEDKIEDIIKKHAAAQEYLFSLLNKFEVKVLEDAIELNRIYEEYANVVNRNKQNLADELDTETYEDIVEKMGEVGDEKKTRNFEIIIKELLDIQHILDIDGNILTKNQNQIDEYNRKYSDKTKLLLNLAEKVNQKQQIEDKIQKLAQLPEDIENVDSFVKQYETTKNELDENKVIKYQLLDEHANLERDMPEESAEELNAQLKQVEENFERVLKKGDAILRIKHLTNEIVDQMDTNIYFELKDFLEQYVSFMTDNRYNQVKLDESLPQGFIREDGTLITYDLLSAGTKDVLAIALRLSMANHFLKEVDGFLIMDDPLVDLDPDRQKKASELIKTYAKEKQILLFTCHPSHAELLGGHQIEI